jgi:hypothetical protein
MVSLVTCAVLVSISGFKRHNAQRQRIDADQKRAVCLPELARVFLEALASRGVFAGAIR